MGLKTYKRTHRADTHEGSTCVASIVRVRHKYMMIQMPKNLVATVAGSGFLLAFAGTASGQPTADSLRQITERGRLLAKYDYAAWHGTDAVVSLVKDDSLIRGYVARETPAGWTVSFGRLSAKSDTFYVAFEAHQRPELPDSFVGTASTPPRPDTDYLLRAARAMELVRAEPPPFNRTYNIAALPADHGEWWVYSMPAQTRSNCWPLGGDLRYRISSDGRSILAKRRLHNVVLEVCTPDQSGKKLLSGGHAAVVDTIPEDTDVFHVLSRGLHVPEMVMTDKYVYRIEVDGTIKLLATAPGR